MQPKTILRKTAKGREEIDKRTHRIAARLRGVLFMIDGQRTVAELLDQAGALAPQLEAQFEELAARGFVEPIVADVALTAAPSPTPTASAPVLTLPNARVLPPAPPLAPAPVTSPPVAPTPPGNVAPSAALLYAKPLQEPLVSGELPAIDGVPVIKNKLQRLLTESMGMKGMIMQTQLQRCSSRSELEAFIEDVARQIALANGSKTGERWREKARKLAQFDTR